MPRRSEGLSVYRCACTCMCICVCMYACICACAYVCVCMYVSLCICMHIHVYAQPCECTYALVQGGFPACSWLALVAGVGGYVLTGVEIGGLSYIFLYFCGC